MQQPKKIPNPSETMDELRDLVAIIYRSLEHGVYEAREHFEVKSLQPEASVFSTLVRLHAKDYLLREDPNAFLVEDINLCGLSLQLPNHWIKIWKSEDAELPLPGDSAPKQDFYQQSLFPEGSVPKPLHLAVLWNLDSLNNLSALWLVCPESGDENSATFHWRLQIPHPATIEVGTSQEAYSTDLPIKLKEEPQIGTKTG